MRFDLTTLPCQRWPAAMLSVLLVLSGCATTPPFDGRVEIVATSDNQPLPDADCTVTTDSGSWTVKTPSQVDVGTPNGDLRVVCNRTGYRTSEVIHRHPRTGLSPAGTRVGVGIAGGTGGHTGVGLSLGFAFPVAGVRHDYPRRIVVDMTPQQ